MLNQDDFINRLHKILDYYNLSASSFADKIEVQRSSISHLLSGRNKPSLEFVMKIIDNYKEVSLNWLLYGKDSFPIKEEKVKEITKKNVVAENSGQLSLLDEAQKKTTILSKIERIVVFYENGTFKEYSEI